MPLMGLPGALLIGLSKPFIYLLHGPMAYEAFSQSLGDKTWPLMIMLSVLWPISIPIAYLICQKFLSDLPFFSVGYFLPFSLIVLLGAAIITTLTIEMNVSVQRLTDTEVLEQALKNGKLSLVKKHWKAADHETYSFGDPLYISLDNKQTKVATYLLDQGVNPKKYSQNVDHFSPGVTPLHTATKTGMTETIKKLLDLGVDPNITTDNGQTPLHNLGSMDKKMLPVLDILKTAGANFGAVDKDGNTPLMTLVMINAPIKHRPLLAQKLIDYGCPADFKNKNGETALSILQKDQPYRIKLIATISGKAQ